MFHFYFHEIWQKVFRRKGKNGTVKGREEKKRKEIWGKKKGNTGGGREGKTKEGEGGEEEQSGSEEQKY